MQKLELGNQIALESHVLRNTLWAVHTHMADAVKSQCLLSRSRLTAIIGNEHRWNPGAIQGLLFQEIQERLGCLD